MFAKTQIKKGGKLQIISLQDKIHTYRYNWIQHLHRMQPLKLPEQMPTSRLKIIISTDVGKVGANKFRRD